MSNDIRLPKTVQTGTPEDNKKFNEEGLDAELEQLRNARNILKNISEKRKKAVEKLADVVESLDESEKIHPDHLSPAHMEIVRDIRRGLSESLNGLEAHDNLLDMVVNDLVAMTETIQHQMDSSQKNAVLLQSIVVMLLDKKLVTNDEFKAAQMKIISEINEAYQRRAQNPTP